MKKIKYFLFAIFAIAFVGCTDDATSDDNGGTSTGDTELYFDDGLTTIFPVTASDKTFAFPVTRSNAGSAATYEYEIDLDGNGYISFDSAGEISFAEGETEAYISGYLISSAPQGYSYEGAVSITNSDYAAIFKTTTFTFTVSFDYTWQLVVGDNNDTTGLWIDGVFSTVFMDVPYFEKDVELYEAEELPGYYRITNLYDAATVATLMGVTESDVSGYAMQSYPDGGDVDTIYTYINATDPDNVYLPYQTTGFMYDSTTYGFVNFATYCDAIFDFSSGSSSYPSTYGKLEDGIISFPAGSLYCELHLYGAWLNNSENHYIFLPGVKFWSQITSISFSDISVENLTANFAFEGNELATSLKYAVVPYDATGESYATTAAGIKDGSISSTQVLSLSFSKVTVTVSEMGAYALVAVPYDVDGDYGKFDASTCVAEFRIDDNIAPGVADGSYAVASVVDAYYDDTFTDVEFILTRSAVTDYDYTSTDFFGFGTSTDITYSWVLDPTAMKMYVTPTDCEGYALDFYEPTYYADDYGSYYYAYIGGGLDGYDPWEINIEWNEAKDGYVMTTFASEARLGIFMTGSYTYVEGYDAVIEVGTAISEYVEASSAPSSKAIFAPVNKATTANTSSVTTAKEKATVRKEGVMPLMK